MRAELLQIGNDVQSLARYIAEHGDAADAGIIKKQAELIVLHAQDLTEVPKK